MILEIEREQAAAMNRIPKKKAPPEGGALGVEAGFIQARNLSSSEKIIRDCRRSGKSLLTHCPASRIWGGFWCIPATVLVALVFYLMVPKAMAQPRHGIAMHGAPALAPGFAHLPYANPDALQGGTVVYGETGGFDSLNPYLLKGRAPWG
nr:hypothetical protein [Desulfuromonadales bacterium]